MVESDLTLAKAFELAQGMEAAEENAKEIQSTDLSSSVQAVAPQRNSRPACHRCLGTGHSPEVCRFKATRCNKCHKLGHIARAYRSEPTYKPTGRGWSYRTPRRRQSHQTHKVDGAEDSDESSEEPVDIVRVHSV